MIGFLKEAEFSSIQFDCIEDADVSLIIESVLLNRKITNIL